MTIESGMCYDNCRNRSNKNEKKEKTQEDNEHNNKEAKKMTNYNGLAYPLTSVFTMRDVLLKALSEVSIKTQQLEKRIKINERQLEEKELTIKNLEKESLNMISDRMKTREQDKNDQQQQQQQQQHNEGKGAFPSSHSCNNCVINEHKIKLLEGRISSLTSELAKSKRYAKEVDSLRKVVREMIEEEQRKINQLK